MQCCILGEVRVFVADGRPLDLGGHRKRMVLALLLHGGALVTVDRLIELVWGDQPPPTARRILQVFVARLRSLLDNGVLTARTAGTGCTSTLAATQRRGRAPAS